ncbi:MAG: hypothetical protein ACKO4Q_16230 [Planctomycetota bacterium]
MSKLTGDFKEANENTKKVIAPRQLFAVAQYTAGKRTVFCAFASEPRKPKALTAFMVKFWAGDTTKIIASEFPCPECGGLGKVKGKACTEGKAWIHSTCEKIKVGKPTEVKKFQRPTKPESAEQYDAL